MFGERLKELREDFNMTQEQLGQIIGINRSTISAYENNTINPTLDVVVKLADTFNVSIDYLACRTKELYNLNTFDSKNKQLILEIIKSIEKYK